MPRLGHDAGSNAILGHIQALQALGWQVEFVAARELAHAEAAAAALEATGVLCHRAPRIASVEEVLRRSPRCFDLVYLHRLSNAEAYAAMARVWQPRAQLLYSVADLHHVRVMREAVLHGNAEQLQESRTLKQRELAAMRLVDTVITHSDVEAAYLAREAPGARVHVVPWAVSAGPDGATPQDRTGIAFVGSYRHSPNADAVRWLNEAVMPLVWQRIPEMSCLIAGSDWPEWLHSATDPRVRFVGQVERLSEVLQAVRLTVAPLRFGAGVKGKVLDSFAAGVPCVMTPVAAEGITLTGVLQGLVAEDAAGLAELICDLYDRPERRRSQEEAGVAMVRRYYTEAVVQQAMARAIGAPNRVLALAAEPNNASGAVAIARANSA
jgi:glycosyltransferase involved in cell wall biosynthesis